MFSVKSPVDGTICYTTKLSTKEEALQVVQETQEAFQSWKSTSLDQRIKLVEQFVSAFVNNKDDIAQQLSKLIGRPKKYNYNEVRGFEERARYLLSIASKSLADVPLEEKAGFSRYIKREPLGVVFLIAAWNYPYLIAVNGIVPALLAGNTVLLKHAPQTFGCADQLKKAASCLPKGVFNILHIDHDVAADVIRHPAVQHVQFTGSVKGGQAVNQIAASRFITVGLELGGNDAAYVRADADLDFAAENVVDGAMYNSGQSCCGIQRVFVHESIYDAFITKVAEITHGYKLGDPFDETSTLGPVINAAAAQSIRDIIQDAVGKGATLLINESAFPLSKPSSPFVAPQIILNAHPSMKIMSEEAFGPVMGVIKVSSDDEAIALINDSQFGLTASIWTRDVETATSLCDRIDTGTVFVNRCDYLDPGLPWVGIKNSGRGCTLSKFGFDALTRPKSYHLRK